MTFTVLREAGRRRLARLRGAQTEGDGGFALVFVMLVSLVIMLGVSTMMVVTASNIAPATHSAEDESALAAAQSGIQAYLAFLNAECTTFDSNPCAQITGNPVNGTVPGAGGGGTESYTTTALNPASYLTDGFLRVKSVGTSGTGTRTLVADFSGQPNLLRYAYLSKYETLGTSFLNSYYPARQIRVDNATDIAAAGLSGAKNVTWAAPTSASGTPGNVGICDQLWYGASGRSAAKTSYDATLPTGMDWSATGSDATFYQPCEVTFTSGMDFNGPVYSDDALYLSYGTQGGTGPTFKVPAQESLPPASTAYDMTDPISTELYREFPGVQGGPSSDSTGWPDNTVQHAVNTLELPGDASGARAKATCVYVGPTRIRLNGNTATITSPMTQADSSNSCYTSAGTSDLVGQKVPVSTSVTLANGTTKTNSAGAASVLEASVDVSKALIYVADAGSGTSWSAATTGSMFDVGSGNAPAVPADPAKTASLSYNPATLSSGASFNTEASSGPNWTSYSGTKSGTTFQQWLNNIVSTTPSTDIVSTISSALTPFNYSSPGNGHYRYLVSSTSTPSTSSTVTNTTVAATESDPLLSSTAGNAALTKQTTTTTITASVYRQGSHCNLINLLGLCIGSWVWDSGGTTQFTVTDTQTDVHYSQVFTPATSSFPVSKDVTQYSTWNGSGNAPGDVYIEGNTSGKLSLVAENDIVVTGPLTTNGTTGTNVRGETDWASGGAVDLVADNNVRIYHPVSCAETPDANTSAGFCPNDITGLYDESNPPTAVITSGGSFGDAHPALQYCNMTTGYNGNTGNPNCSAVTATGSGAVSQIDAAVIALNGSLMTDNFNRGEPLGDTTVTGGIYQLHRGATGQQWEVKADDTSRVASGYLLQDSYLDLEPASLPYVPDLQYSSGNQGWSVISTSSAPASGGSG